MCRSPAPPPAPDYRGAAEATAQSNNQQLARQTFANRPTMRTPWGTSTWTTGTTTDPATGEPVTTWENNIQLSPEEQAALSAQQRITAARSGMAEGMLDRVRASVADPFSTEGLPGFHAFQLGMQGGNAPLDEFTSTPGQRNQQSVTGAGEGINREMDSRSDELTRDIAGPGAYNESATEAIRGRQSQQLERERAALETRLMNQGLSPGSEAWKAAMDDYSRRANDADLAAITAGIAQGNTEFQQGLQRGQFQNAATGQAQTQDLGAAGFENTAQQQGFTQGAQQTTQNNDTRMRDAQFVLQQGAANNQVRQQNLDNSNRAIAANNQANTNFGNYQAAMREQAMRERLNQRQMPLNELNSFLTGQQIGMPSFGGPNSTAGRGVGVDYTGAARDAYGAQMDQFSAAQAGRQSMMNGLFRLGGAAMGMPFGFGG